MLFIMNYKSLKLLEGFNFNRRGFEVGSIAEDGSGIKIGPCGQIPISSARQNPILYLFNILFDL